MNLKIDALIEQIIQQIGGTPADKMPEDYPFTVKVTFFNHKNFIVNKAKYVNEQLAKDAGETWKGLNPGNTYKMGIIKHGKK